MNKQIKTIPGLISIIAAIIAIPYAILFFTYPHNNYVKGDIDDIEYAEPTEEARNFDLEGYINSLPEIEYEKKDYPIKEMYEYEFNNYILTVDIPEGYHTYELNPPRRIRVINSTSVDDSCEYLKNMCSGPSTGIFKDTTVPSDATLCINKLDNSDSSCDGGIGISPYKSKYKGISLRDVYVYNREFKDDEYKYIIKSGIGFIISAYSKYSVSMIHLVSDQQGIRIGFKDLSSKDVYFNIIDSIKIKGK